MTNVVTYAAMLSCQSSISKILNAEVYIWLVPVKKFNLNKHFISLKPQKKL
jgi:hypothetical protein